MKKKPQQTIIGLVYDFDGTLSPNNMQEDTIFKEYGIDKDLFWKRAQGLVEQGYERTLAYLKLLISDDAFQKNPLSRSKLQSLAKSIEYYPGVREYFNHITQFMNSIPEVSEWGITIEHYIISSGMVEILEGIDIHQHFKKVYACEYDFQDGRPVFPKLVINDTNKTQFLFRINKGRLHLREDINTHMPDAERRIPFQNMIYIGDSDTDIPSMTVVRKFDGHVIAVFDPKRGEVNRQVREIVESKNAHFAPADFRKDSLLIKILQRTLKKIVHTIAYRGSAQMSLDWVRRHRTNK